MPFLRLTIPAQTGTVGHILEGARITIGRAPDNTIQISDGSVSAHHAELILTDGHYRLHDLESTNLTCVDARPVRDFHLHVSSLIRFGNVEGEFTPEIPPELSAFQDDLAPSKSEIDFLQRDNRDLQNKIAVMQRQLEILGAVTLQPLDLEGAVVPAQAHRRILAERDALLRENAALKRDAANFKRDIDTVLRDRDALRQAFATAKADLAGIAM